jgi:hypothetical protein
MAPHEQATVATPTTSPTAPSLATTRPTRTSRRLSQQRLWNEIRRLMPGRSVVPTSSIFNDVEIGEVTPITPRIITHIRSRCPIADDGRTVAETHRLVYIPAKIDDDATSIESLRLFAADRAPLILPLFSSYRGLPSDELQRTTIHRGIWVLEYHDIAPHSTCFSEGNTPAAQYRTAHAIEHAGILTLSALENGERLFRTTYGRTNDRFASGEAVCIGNLHGANPIAPRGALYAARVGRVLVWDAKA